MPPRASSRSRSRSASSHSSKGSDWTRKPGQKVPPVEQHGVVHVEGFAVAKALLELQRIDLRPRPARASRCRPPGRGARGRLPRGPDAMRTELAAGCCGPDPNRSSPQRRLVRFSRGCLCPGESARYARRACAFRVGRVRGAPEPSQRRVEPTEDFELQTGHFVLPSHSGTGRETPRRSSELERYAGAILRMLAGGVNDPITGTLVKARWKAVKDGFPAETPELRRTDLPRHRGAAGRHRGAAPDGGEVWFQGADQIGRLIVRLLESDPAPVETRREEEDG